MNYNITPIYYEEREVPLSKILEAIDEQLRYYSKFKENYKKEEEYQSLLKNVFMDIVDFLEGWYPAFKESQHADILKLLVEGS